MYNTNTDILFAGAFAAVTVDLLVYPLDTLKTRIQSPHYARLYKDPATGAVRRGVLFRGLYQGVWSVIFATIPSSGAFFTTYEAIKHVLTTSSTSSPTPEKNLLPFTHPLPTPVIHGIASSIAESVSCFILTPAEVLKQNAQMITARSPGTRGQSATLSVLSQFRRHPTRLWSGYTALVARNLPFTGIHFPIFEYLRGHMIDWRREYKARAAAAAGASVNQQEQSGSSDADQLVERAGITAVAAGMAGSVAAVVTTPIDVVKTRIMLSAGEGSPQQQQKQQQQQQKPSPSTVKRDARKPGAWAVGRDIYYREGIKGLFSGGALRAGWTAIGLGLYLGAYEGGRFYLENRRKNRSRAELGVKGEEKEAVI
ncbi:hypothetical protein VTN00DRAFT_4387 [Thermoascus crustaceus]|uniref:uncharacterized protein n=1 Tax=Thermoascus crustaceus TaxID=5088 RepID=UPI0037445991